MGFGIEKCARIRRLSPPLRRRRHGVEPALRPSRSKCRWHTRRKPPRRFLLNKLSCSSPRRILIGSSGAPRRHALHMLQRHTCVSSHARAHYVCTNSPHPRPQQEREARLAPSVSSSAKRSTPSTSLPPRGNACKFPRSSTCVGARARGAHAFGAERVARGGEKAAAGARARSAHALGAERVARGGDGSQRLRRLAHRRAPPSARSAVRRAPSA